MLALALAARLGPGAHDAALLLAAVATLVLAIKDCFARRHVRGAAARRHDSSPPGSSATTD